MKHWITSLMVTAALLVGAGTSHVWAAKSFSQPLSGTYITQKYGKQHRAIDYQRYKRDKGFVGSIGDGKVIRVKRDAKCAYGWHVMVDHGDGYVSVYSHLSGISVLQGQKVKKGKKVGNMGKTGRVRAKYPILHLEVIKDGKKINPMSVMK
ncbi:M23 family metallopeptidase [Polycladomyces sp. WAk]|uniref:M23 family metallopeptidase n=1 Tax=Polycladomyces zharkentensis TaxID=2807616 RepID=A0ABS2WL10_9BACL|nr:M23 family metallopeptidase [Polycladomyces sp. WAk]